MMKCTSSLLALLFGPLLHAQTPAITEGHDHPPHRDNPTATALTLNKGEKWKTDAPLRAGMTKVRDALANNLDSIHKNDFSAAQYQALAAKLFAATAEIVKKCKLEPSADAALHVILADIMGGAESMKSGTDAAARQAGAIRVLGGIVNYPKYFVHPGWQEIKH